VGWGFDKLKVEMPLSLPQVLSTLCAHEAELRRRGGCHAFVFGFESADVVNRKTLKPLLRDAIRRDAVNAF